MVVQISLAKLVEMRAAAVLAAAFVCRCVLVRALAAAGCLSLAARSCCLMRLAAGGR
jgi:hypothetical protein